jgi:ParB family chromosome partitioning protein
MRRPPQLGQKPRRSEGRRHLAGDHRRREVPRRDGGHDAHGLLQHDDAAVTLVAGDDVAVAAPGLFGKPAEENGGIGDFTPGLSERLALLGGHDAG